MRNEAADGSEPVWSPKLLWLVPAMVSGMLPFTLLSPVLVLIQQNWFAGVDCGKLPDDDANCKAALSHASLAVSIATAVGAAFSFLCAPLIGRLSDSFGRRFVFIFSSSLSVPAAFFLFATDQWRWSLYWYYASYTFFILSPDFVGYSAFIADVSTDTQRRHSFGVLGAW